MSALLSELVAQSASFADRFSSEEELERACAASGRWPPEPKRTPLKTWTPIEVGLPAPSLSGVRRAVARVCIASPDLVGPVRNGGVGTAYTSLARALAAAGHRVTLLHTLEGFCESGTQSEWRARYADEGIAFESLSKPAVEVKGPKGARESYLAYQWLSRRDFDIVHFPEMSGVGFYSLQAKRLGVAFRETTLCVGLHSPTLWHRAANGEPLDSPDLLSVDHLERQCVALADVLVSPSNYLVDWICRAGWRLPQKVCIQPYVRPVAQPSLVQAAPLGKDRHRIRELVFFGRLETRKGLELFCDALDRLSRVNEGRLPGGARVLFLGKAGTVAGIAGDDYVRRRAARWAFPWEVATGLSQPEAVQRLSRPETLAVIPSLADNTPNTVLECLALRVPFLAAATGGIPEMLAPEHCERVLFAPEPEALTAALERALRGGHAPARSAREAAVVEAEWIAWHAGQVGAAAASEPEAREAQEARRATKGPRVSVCLATRNRPGPLAQALDSLRVQRTRPHRVDGEAERPTAFEVIVVDDGSDAPEALSRLGDLEATVASLGGRFLRSRQRFPGAARNWAAAHARGEYLLFMDDDNVAHPDEVATLLAAAERSGAPIVCSIFDTFRGPTPPAREQDVEFRWLPIGQALPLAMMENVLGDTNLLIRRETFFELGRFPEERRAGAVEDWQLLSRAALAGIEQAVLPEPLFSYRLWEDGAGQGVAAAANAARGLLPYLELGTLAPAVFGLLARYASGLHHRQGQLESVALEAREAEQKREGLFRRGRPLLVVGPSDAARLVPLRQLEVSAEAGAIVLVSRGEDPGLLLPVAPQALHRAILEVDLTVTQPTRVQLFWKTFDNPGCYTEDESLSLHLAPGRTRRYVELPGSWLGALRLDPATAPGVLRLHRLELRDCHGVVERPAGRGWRSQVVELPGVRRALDAVATAARKVTAWELQARGAGAGRELSELFRGAHPLVDLRTEAGRGLSACYQLECRAEPGALVLRSTGEDPRCELRGLDGTRAGALVVRLEVTSPAPVEAQFFWKRRWSQDYSESRSVRVPIEQGYNLRFIEIPARTVGALRFDPANAPGEYAVHSLEVRALR